MDVPLVMQRSEPTDELDQPVTQTLDVYRRGVDLKGRRHVTPVPGTRRRTGPGILILIERPHLRGTWRFGDLIAPTNPTEKRHTIEQLHRKQPLVSFFDELEQLDEVRMGQPCQGPKLLLEAQERFGLDGSQRLDRDAASALTILRFVNDAHPSFPEATQSDEATPMRGRRLWIAR